jgi:hypothetical protein
MTKHKEFGKFVKQWTGGGTVVWKSPSGVAVSRRVYSKDNVVLSQGDRYVGPGGGCLEADQFLQDRYGIDTKDASRGVVKQRRRTSEQVRLANYVHYD